MKNFQISAATSQSLDGEVISRKHRTPKLAVEVLHDKRSSNLYNIILEAKKGVSEVRKPRQNKRYRHPVPIYFVKCTM